MKQAATAVLAFILLIAGCAGGEQAEPVPEIPPGLVEVTIEAMDFTMPDEIPSGWTTFRTTNNSAMVHMGVVERMPEGYGLREQQDQVAPVFQEGMNLIIQGDMDGAMAIFGELPEWFGRIVFLGGPGLLAPGQVTETSAYLEPGTYILECYVKTDGVFHSYNPAPEMDGMIAQFTVTAEPSGAQEPTPSIEIAISNETGMEITGEPTAGEHQVAVHFTDQAVHEHFLGHDVHLVRLTPETDQDALVAWMNWSLPAGLQTPAPAVFLGGTNELPAGGTAYFKATLEPGEYAWIAEVPSADQKAMLQRFTVK
ncbi:MAG: hypothetical protein IFK94_10585 [Acidobacteria bacterium]|uniref:Uncharacterized protein n=1 Tax=Candidatus Polarisedimenticola svalbardensis TaxID=2886004 RepID=A0A8J6Y1C0_9BACT|nr:hypothetical protein [Candidatus Polarisedimenticola svalbardensis]